MPNPAPLWAAIAGTTAGTTPTLSGIESPFDQAGVIQSGGGC